LADEPTGSLDRQNALNLTQLLLELSKEQQTALMVVTHSAEVAGEMDIIYKLNAGTLQRMN
jgi:ABC-type lipoprotein export system ATPase subunit